jgi:hypothetical protein
VLLNEASDLPQPWTSDLISGFVSIAFNVTDGNFVTQLIAEFIAQLDFSEFDLANFFLRHSILPFQEMIVSWLP